MFNVMVIAMLTAITIWWFLVRKLREKPWTHKGIIPTSQETITSSAPKVGLVAFLAVVSSFFGLFSSAYLMRMHGHGGLAAWDALDEPNVLWLNTLVLVLASAAMQITRSRAEKFDFGGVRRYFSIGGFLTLVFLAGQVFAWQQASQGGTLGVENPAYSFFVLLTTIHGLHLVGGLFVLARTTTRVWNGIDAKHVATRRQILLSVQLCTTYWHWLLLIWLGLFALLLST